MVDNLVTKSDMMRTSMGLPLKDMVEDTSLIAGNILTLLHFRTSFFYILMVIVETTKSVKTL